MVAFAGVMENVEQFWCKMPLCEGFFPLNNRFIIMFALDFFPIFTRHAHMCREHCIVEHYVVSWIILINTKKFFSYCFIVNICFIFLHQSSSSVISKLLQNSFFFFLVTLLPLFKRIWFCRLQSTFPLYMVLTELSYCYVNDWSDFNIETFKNNKTHTPS